MKSQLDVVLVGPLAPPRGGISAHVERLASLLEDDNLRVGILDHFANTQHPLVISNLHRNPARYWMQMRRLRTPIVHYHHARWSTLMAAALARGNRGETWIVTFHGHEIERSLTRRTPAIAALTRWAVKRFDRVIAVSEAVGNVVRRETGSDVTIIPAYLPPDERSDNKEHSAPVAPTAIVAAYRVAPRSSEDLYGLDVASAIVASASVLVPDLHYKLFLAQAPRNARERRYLAQVLEPLKSAGLEQRLTVHVGAELAPAFQRGAIYLRTTRTDGDAVSIREALSRGIPVLASDVVERPLGTIQLPLNDIPAWVNALSQSTAPSRARSTLPVSHAMSANALLSLYRELVSNGHSAPKQQRAKIS
jgi:glycogen(starch) synthase